MFKWFKQKEINRLLVELAGVTAYKNAWADTGASIALELRKIAEINERLRQLGYKEQDNG